MSTRSCPSPALSRRGSQFAAATVLGIITVLLIAGTIALGITEEHKAGPDNWFRVHLSTEVIRYAAPAP